MKEHLRLRVFGTALGFCLTAALGLLPGEAGAQTAAIPPGGPAPNLRVQKSCLDAPQLGANMVQCRVDVDNQLGTANSGGPTTIVDNPTSSPAGATFAGRDPSSTFQCSTPAGGLPSAINCSFPSGLTFGNQPGNGGPVFLNFVVPPGTTLRNCATASQTQNTATRPDSNQANNTNICTSFTRPPAGNVTVTKSCAPGANHSTTCTVTVTNHTSAAIPTGTAVSDTLTGAPAGTVITGAAGLACPGALSQNAIQCTTTSPIAATNGTATFLFSFRTPAAASFRNCAAIRSAPTIAQGCTGVVTQ